MELIEKRRPRCAFAFHQNSAICSASLAGYEVHGEEGGNFVIMKFSCRLFVPLSLWPAGAVSKV